MNYKQNIVFSFFLLLEGICYFIASLFGRRLDLMWSMDYFCGIKEDLHNMIREDSSRTKKRTDSKSNLQSVAEDARKIL